MDSYFDLETYSVDRTPDIYKDKIVAITFAPFSWRDDFKLQFTECLMISEYGTLGDASEKAMLQDFIKRTNILSNQWNFVPHGANIGIFDLLIFAQRVRYHNLGVFDLRRPYVDIKNILVVANRGQFKEWNRKLLEKGKQGDGSEIAGMVERAEWDRIKAYSIGEIAPFFSVLRELRDRLGA